MRATTENKRNRSATEGAALWVLGVLVATILLAPAAALADDATLSAACKVVDGGREHTITATFPSPADTPVDVTFSTMDGSFASNPPITPVGDTAEFIFASDVDVDYTVMAYYVTADGVLHYPTVTTDYQNCAEISQSDPSNNSVPVYGRPKLNVNRHGFLTLKICGTEEFNVDGVDLRSVSLEGVSPRYHKKRDLKDCPGGKDGYEDVKFKFKKGAIVKALMKKVDRKLIDGEVMELEFTGTYNGHTDLTALDGKLQEGTPIDGTYEVEIVNKCKKKHWRRWWRNHKKKCAKYYKH